jgi:hypothetical protein
VKVECGCGAWHDLTPTAMIVVINAFQEGELQVVKGKDGIVSSCLFAAFTPDRIQRIEACYPGRKLSIEVSEEKV